MYDLCMLETVKQKRKAISHRRKNLILEFKLPQFCALNEELYANILIYYCQVCRIDTEH